MAFFILLMFCLAQARCIPTVHDAIASGNSWNSQRLLSRKELASHFAVCPRTIIRWGKKGLPKLGGKGAGVGVRYVLEDCVEWLKNAKMP